MVAGVRQIEMRIKQLLQRSCYCRYSASECVASKLRRAATAEAEQRHSRNRNVNVPGMYIIIIFIKLKKN